MNKEVQIKPFKKVLVANRGEIAIRVFRALNELGITTVSIYSREDRYALFRSKADESYQLDTRKGPIDAYLDIDTIIKIALAAKVDAIHPGYGFLSENPEFVDACERNGIVFIGPSSQIMNAMGDKISSKKMAIEAKVPIIPGVDYSVKDIDTATKVANSVGFPIMLKASNGGGGRGMRIVNCVEDLEKEFEEAKNESKKAFGDDKLFIEKYLRGPKHIEVQVLGDNYGNVVHLFDRNCSVQRRHQKVVEYAPAFSLPEETRQTIFDAAIRLSKAVGYKNAGTLEFLVDEDNNPYFIEMNPRIQVEHTVSEMVTNVDLVQSQILIAEGYPLDSDEINIKSQDDIKCVGYSIQTRVTTEDPSNNFLPDTGEITVYRSGSGNGIRLDGGNAYVGAVIAPYYDSLLVKVISLDRTFAGAVKKSVRALTEMRIRGVKTNIPFLINVLKHPNFQSGDCYTTFIEETPELFQLTESQDRATKIIEFIGDRIVNSGIGKKPHYENRVLPEFDESKPVYGARDEFLKLGAQGYMQKILKEDKLYVTDTTMRDAGPAVTAGRAVGVDRVARARTRQHRVLPVHRGLHHDLVRRVGVGGVALVVGTHHRGHVAPRGGLGHLGHRHLEAHGTGFPRRQNSQLPTDDAARDGGTVGSGALHEGQALGHLVGHHHVAGRALAVVGHRHAVGHHVTGTHVEGVAGEATLPHGLLLDDGELGRGGAGPTHVHEVGPVGAVGLHDHVMGAGGRIGVVAVPVGLALGDGGHAPLGQTLDHKLLAVVQGQHVAAPDQAGPVAAVVVEGVGQLVAVAIVEAHLEVEVAQVVLGGKAVALHRL